MRSRKQDKWPILWELPWDWHTHHNFGISNFRWNIWKMWKKLNRIAPLVDSRGMQPSSLLIVFDRFTQMASIKALLGNATMLIARDARFSVTNLKWSFTCSVTFFTHEAVSPIRVLKSYIIFLTQRVGKPHTIGQNCRILSPIEWYSL